LLAKSFPRRSKDIHDLPFLSTTSPSWWRVKKTYLLPVSYYHRGR